ncbi:hypothetical protein, partial [Propionibacterium freudenreichii]|uniref:hypothetical protein n=1 Tax=Propionibacterium freudenreichii TaxID=1744 RepID=UPI003851D269
SGIKVDGEEIPLIYLRTENHEIGRIRPFKGWDVLIFTTPFAPKLDVNPGIGSSYRSPNFSSPIASLAGILKQAKLNPRLN